MLKINNIKLKKYRAPLLLFAISLGGIFLYQYLTFIPEYSSATEISTEDPITPTTPVKEWDKLKYMQQMTLEACNSVDTPAAKNGTTINTNVPAKQLIDSRDGKTYWIAKLADGNCWMTQNLDLDLNGVTLKTDDSDVSSDWVSTAGPSTTSGYSNSNYYLAQYYDPGYAYYTNNGTTKNDLSEADGKALATNTSGDTNAHSLQGNLYSWTAATAGSGDGSFINSSSPGWPEASDSICPKGWKLPTSANTDTTKKSFGGLTTTYSISDNSTGSGLMRANPFYFIYGGYVNNSSFNDAGSYGRYWSSTARSSNNAYYLYLYSNNANPSVDYHRYYGYSVRCVAAGTPAGSTTPSDPSSGITDPTLSVSVPNIITLDVYSDPEDKKNNVVNIDANTNDINTGEFIAEVSANTSYKITLNSTSEDPDTTSLIGKKDNGELNGHSIPTLTTNTDASGNTTYIQPQKGISSWGIRTCTSLLLSSCDTEQYKPLPEHDQTPGTINPFYTGTPGSNQSTLFQIGIGISPNLPSGTYSTQIQVTASSTGSN